MDLIRPEGVIGRDVPRVDAVAKVTGRTRYCADLPVPESFGPVAHGALALSAVARGRIRAIDERAARALPGVLDVFTYRNVGKAVRGGRQNLKLGRMATGYAPLSSNRVRFAGQLVALVVAESAAVAREGAEALVFDYAADRPSATFDAPGAHTTEARALGETAVEAGEVEPALARAPVVVDAHYATPAQHHNPMELFQATCAWDGDDLTVWESSQHVRGFQYALATQLRVRAANVRVLSPVVGGAFGSCGEIGQMTAVIAFAAKQLGRPVKVVASRREGFTLRTFRAETRHHLKLGAERDGRLTAMSHESWELTGRTDKFATAGSDATTTLYACPNVRTKVWNVEADRQTPGFMRAPPETPYLFALECAVDELAVALALDPLELRRRNDTMIDPVKGRPFTSRSLLQCIDAGAAAFGWDRRTPEPGSMRDGDELVGYGYATAFYPTQMGPAEARVTLTPDLRVRVETGTHEIGTGIATVVAQTAADRLGVPVDAVEVVIGDSALPPTPLAAGSNTTASVCTVVAQACDTIRTRVIAAAVGSPRSPLHGEAEAFVRIHEGALVAGGVRESLGAAVQRVARGRPVVAKATNTPHGIPPVAGPLLTRRGFALIKGGPQLNDRVQFAFGAQFVEVRVDRATGMIRVPRAVGAFAAGRIMNPRTARSQLMGGQIWGIAAALLEATELDHRSARYVNPDLAEYHIATNADVPHVETIMLDERDDLVNPLGIKGVGELGITGVNAAVANAVYHATGVRLRRLPIRLDDVLPALQEVA